MEYFRNELKGWKSPEKNIAEQVILDYFITLDDLHINEGDPS